MPLAKDALPRKQNSCNRTFRHNKRVSRTNVAKPDHLSTACAVKIRIGHPSKNVRQSSAKDRPFEKKALNNVLTGWRAIPKSAPQMNGKLSERAKSPVVRPFCSPDPLVPTQVGWREVLSE